MEGRVHWVLYETKSLLRTVPMGEMYPFQKQDGTEIQSGIRTFSIGLLSLSLR